MSPLEWFWLVFSLILTGWYALVTLRYHAGWSALPAWQMPPGWRPRTRVSVVIAARNEAQTIGPCLRGILSGHYPAHLLEILVVDDHSDDGTAAEAAAALGPPHRVLSLAEALSPGVPVNSYKKKALELGIARAAGELIVITDADCTAGPDWLPLVVSAYETRGWKAVAAPVLFHREAGVFERFQSLDFAGLMGITAAGIHRGTQRLANGANLAFPRTVFFEVNGYADNDDRASGDDLFLVQKIARRYPGAVGFVKHASATVYTRAKPDWPSFVAQRLRWGTKNAALPEWPVRLALAAVFLLCWSLVVNLALAGCWQPALWLFFVQLAVKVAVDYAFLRAVCRFFGRTELLRTFWPALGLHIVYIVVVGTASLVVRRYTWKGRRVQ